MALNLKIVSQPCTGLKNFSQVYPPPLPTENSCMLNCVLDDWIEMTSQKERADI